MTLDISELGTILGVWAHPDDEAYLSSAIMASAVENGQRVVCVTATRGEKGSWDEERWPTVTMGEVREAELMQCLEILGVTDHRWLDYVDAECDHVSFEEAVGKIVDLIGEVQPDSVLTFGPEGMTDHPDHKAVSRWTTEAFRRAAKPGASLFYATQTQAWADKFVPILARFNVFEGDTPPITPEDELAIDVRLDGDLLGRKVRALMAHASQMEGMKSVFGEQLWWDSQSNEWYRLAATK
ncbi:MAG: PIG-L deacetylase family protein [Actinomycetota bacterium]